MFYAFWRGYPPERKQAKGTFFGECFPHPAVFKHIFAPHQKTKKQAKPPYILKNTRTSEQTSIIYSIKIYNKIYYLYKTTTYVFENPTY
jgi:hypothetical protein